MKLFRIFDIINRKYHSELIQVFNIEYQRNRELNVVKLLEAIISIRDFCMKNTQQFLKQSVKNIRIFIVMTYKDTLLFDLAFDS